MLWIYYVILALSQIDVCRSAELGQVDVRQAGQVDVRQVHAEDRVPFLALGLGFVFLDGLVGGDDQPDLVAVVVFAVLHDSRSVLSPALEHVQSLLAGEGLDLVGLVAPLASSHSAYFEPAARVLARVGLHLPAVLLAVLQHAQALVIGLDNKRELVGVLEDHELLSWISHVVADLEFSISSVCDSKRLGGVERGEYFVGLSVGRREDCRHFLEGVQASHRIDLRVLLICRDDEPDLVVLPVEAPLDDLRSRRCPALEHVQNLAAEAFYVESQPNELPILYWRDLEVSALVLRPVGGERGSVLRAFLSDPEAEVGGGVDQCELAIIVVDVKLLVGGGLVVVEDDCLAGDGEALGLVEGGEDLVEAAFGLIEHAYKSIIS